MTYKTACVVALCLVLSCGFVSDEHPEIYLVKNSSDPGTLHFHLESNHPLQSDTVVLIQLDTYYGDMPIDFNIFILFIAGRTATWKLEASPYISVTSGGGDRTVYPNKINVTILPADERFNVELPQRAYYKGELLNGRNSKNYELISVRHQFQPYKVGEPSELSQ